VVLVFVSRQLSAVSDLGGLALNQIRSQSSIVNRPAINSLDGRPGCDNNTARLKFPDLALDVVCSKKEQAHVKRKPKGLPAVSQVVHFFCMGSGGNRGDRPDRSTRKEARRQVADSQGLCL